MSEASTRELLADLARARATFQLRAILAVLGAAAPAPPALTENQRSPHD